jgi:peptidoglycan/LPS O-acetylase OafA/YrhL
MRRGDFAVPGFFVLSGFLIARNYARWFEQLNGRRLLVFLGLRLTRIYPVHLLTLLCVAVLVVGAHRLGLVLSSTGYSGREFFLNVLLLHAWTPHLILSWNYPSWSISSEWFVYLLFPLLSRFLRPAVRRPTGAVVGFLVAGTLSILVLLLWSPLPFRELAAVGPIFFVGMVANEISELVDNKQMNVPRWLPATAAAAIIASCYVRGLLGLCVLLLALYGLVLCLALVGRAARTWVSPPLLILGEVSYSLYMTHTLAQKVLWRVLPTVAFSDRPVMLRLAVLAAYATVIALLCLGTYALVERPCRLWGRRRVEGPQDSIASGALELGRGWR